MCCARPPNQLPGAQPKFAIAKWQRTGNCRGEEGPLLLGSGISTYDHTTKQVVTTIQMTQIGHWRIVINPFNIVLDQHSLQAKPSKLPYLHYKQLQKDGSE